MLSERELYIIELIKFYRSKGWGYYRIGRKLWPYLNPRTAQMRVIRLLKKYEKYNKSQSNPSDKKYSDSIRRLSDIVVDEKIERIPKLGRTEKLVLYALKTLGGRARFSVIVAEVAMQLGIGNRDVVKKRVWAALQRLVLRGLVGRMDGVYWLSRELGPSRILVENFRIQNHRGTIQVWSKKAMGRPANLEEALLLSTLVNASRTVQVELSSSLSKEFSQFMGNNGISIIKIYRDPHRPYNGRAKVEVSFDRPPNLYPNIAERDRWIAAFLSTLRRLVDALIHGGLVGGLQFLSGR